MDPSLMVCNVDKWIEENNKFFLPPVCNKLMHDKQINVMFVGGPNQRADYHIEGGEELFLQLRGDMLLKVVEKNQHRDVVIKEGEIFLLPRAIPHSPQRFAKTVGLVIERNRLDSEIDGLRYYMNKDGVPTTTSLYEAWFPWEKQKHRMAEFFDEYYKSEQSKTGKPIPGTIPAKSPTEVDCNISLGDPCNLFDWIQNNAESIDSRGRLAVFDSTYHQLQVYVYGKGHNTECFMDADTWIWQLRGESYLKTGSSVFSLKKDDSVLIPAGKRFHIQQEQGSLSLVCSQVPYHPDETGQHVTPTRS